MFAARGAKEMLGAPNGSRVGFREPKSFGQQDCKSDIMLRIYTEMRGLSNGKVRVGGFAVVVHGVNVGEVEHGA